MPARSEWVPAFLLDDVPVGGAKLFSHEERRIAVFRPEPGQAFALDDRCPHEGYPLVRGYVKDCVVTCIWHNFKFDLRDGRCVMGDEHARSYPLRIVDGRIELDVTDTDPALAAPRLFASLESGLCERKLGQIARDVVRLLRIGVAPAEVALTAARFDAEFADYGTTHVLPVACDVLGMLGRYPGVQAALPLMQAFDLASDDHQRRPRRPVPAPIDPGDDAEAAGARLRAAVEAEDVAAAEALLRGALQLRRWDRAVIEPWLYRLCTDHFLDAGHALIYQVKIFDLLDAVGFSHAPSLLPAHLVRIVSGTREEAVPEWQWLRERLAAYEPKFADWLARNEKVARHPAAGAELQRALGDGDREAVLGALVHALEAGAGLGTVADALILGGGERLLRFDPAIDVDPTVQEGWLDVTHRLTFACAVATALQRHRAPDVLRLVFFAAFFIHLARPLDLPEERRPSLAPEPVSGGPEQAAGAVVAAVRGHDGAVAVARAAGYLAAGYPVATLRAALEDATLRDPATQPIFVGHLLKTCVAAFDAHAAMAGHPDRDRPLLAFVRYFATPAQERGIAQLVHEAIGFVVNGKVPRRLT